jgi:hypothetical protein
MKIYFDDVAPTPAFTYLKGLSPLPPEPAATEPARRQRRELRNWQKFMLCYSLIMAGGALILYSIDGLLTALVGLAIWLLTALIILAPLRMILVSATRRSKSSSLSMAHLPTSKPSKAAR